APAVRLENVLQSELHNTWWSGTSELAELAARCGYVRVQRTEAVGNVKRFRSELKRLAFAECEDSRQSHIEIPGRGTHDTIVAEVAVRTGSRYREGVPVEVETKRGNRSGGIDIAQDLIRPLP